MTATTFQITYDALPKKGQAELLSFMEYIQHKYFAKKHKFPKNPNNPSPSGDPYWDNPKNLAALEEAMNSKSSGAVIRTRKELHNFLDSL